MNVHPMSAASWGGWISFLFPCECVLGLRLRLLRDRVEGVARSFGVEQRVGVGRGLESYNLCVQGLEL